VSEADLIAACVRAIYGENGKGAAAAALDVNKRAVQKWCAGSEAVPQWVWVAVRDLMIHRSGDLVHLLKCVEPLTIEF
jgi:hypothetical protein